MMASSEAPWRRGCGDRRLGNGDRQSGSACVDATLLETIVDGGQGASDWGDNSRSAWQKLCDGKSFEEKGAHVAA